MTNIEKVNAFLDKAGVWFFLTTNGERPKGRPFSFHLLKDGVLYFGTGTEKNAYKEFIANPKVEILAVCDGQFLRYDGTAVVVDDDDLAEAVLQANPAIHTFINEEAGSKFALFRLADGHAVLGSMKGHTEEFDV